MYETKPETDRNRIARDTIQLPEEGDEKKSVFDAQEEADTFDTYFSDTDMQAEPYGDRRKQLALLMEDQHEKNEL